MKVQRMAIAWVAMLVVGALVWSLGGAKLLPAPSPTPTPVASVAVAASVVPSPSPSPGAAAGSPYEGAWVDPDDADFRMVLIQEGPDLRADGQGESALFKAKDGGYELIENDTVIRLELDEEGNLQAITTDLSGEGQARVVKSLTRE